MERMITDERTDLQYELCGNVYLLAGEEATARSLGRWGRRHLEYLKTNKRICYYQLLTSGRLDDYLCEIDRQAEKMYWRLIRQYAERDGITEQLKADDQMEWVQRMNNIKSAVTEVISNRPILPRLPPHPNRSIIPSNELHRSKSQSGSTVRPPIDQIS